MYAFRSPHKYTIPGISPAVVFEYVGFNGVNDVGIHFSMPMSPAGKQIYVIHITFVDRRSAV